MDYFYNNSSKEESGENIKKRRIAKEIYEWVDAVVIAIIAIILLFLLIAFLEFFILLINNNFKLLIVSSVNLSLINNNVTK